MLSAYKLASFSKSIHNKAGMKEKSTGIGLFHVFFIIASIVITNNAARINTIPSVRVQIFSPSDKAPRYKSFFSLYLNQIAI